MNDKQRYSEDFDSKELPQEAAPPLAYDLGYIRVKGAAWTSQWSSPIYIGEVILDLGL